MSSELELLLAKHPDVRINNYSDDIVSIEKGIIFLYANWSHAIVQLRNLIQSLGAISIPLYFFDIDNPDSLRYFDKNELRSDGWGETYWVRDGKIVSTLKKYNSQNIEELILNNALLK
ncbi:hypothetical protein PV783_15330 [Chitinophaga sp. CC14]|uniref:hypothetical protein n=1 Tax=Chitinophaga sp. CC14 TaxID=3029199 RepID=UPI003B807C5B